MSKGCWSLSLAHNVLQIPEEGDFGTQNFQLTMNLNRRKILESKLGLFIQSEEEINEHI
jgi:hypothetical protein